MCVFSSEHERVQSTGGSNCFRGFNMASDRVPLPPLAAGLNDTIETIDLVQGTSTSGKRICPTLENLILFTATALDLWRTHLSNFGKTQFVYRQCVRPLGKLICQLVGKLILFTAKVLDLWETRLSSFGKPHFVLM